MKMPWRQCRLPTKRGKSFLCTLGVHEYEVIGFLDLDQFDIKSDEHQHIPLARCTRCHQYQIDPFGTGVISDGEEIEGLWKTEPPAK